MDLRSARWITKAWPYDLAYRLGPGRIGTLSSAARFHYRRVVSTGQLLRPALQLVAEFRPDWIWAVLDTPVVFRLGRALSKRTGVPLVTTVWDPPDGITILAGLDRLSVDTACRDHAKAIRASTRCGVVSEAMQLEYEETFNVPCVVLRHAPPFAPAAVRQTSDEHAEGSPFRIAFCGSLYAATEWNALIAALDTIGWHLGSRPISLRVIGAGVHVKTMSRAHVEYFGYQTPMETRRLLVECDVGYIPYWFDPRFANSVRLCFPTKLTAYLAAGLPVFFHGPRDSSPTEFLSRFPAGVSCHSLDSKAIASAIVDLASDSSAIGSMRRAGQQALQEELNETVLFERFAELFGISKQA